MKILLDNSEIDITLGDEKIWGDFIASFGSELQKNNASITELSLDNAVIPVEEIDSFMEEDIDFSKNLAIKTITVYDVLEKFSSIIADYEPLCEKLMNISSEFQSGKDAQVHETIKVLATTLEEFFGFVPYFALFPEYFENFVIQEKQVADFVRDFSAVLDEFLNAFETNDIVLVSDIAEYEIVPLLEAILEARKSL